MNRLSNASPTTGDLESAAKRLLTSELFRGVTNEYPLAEKQAILLVLAGCKLVAEVASGHWISTQDGQRTVPDDAAAVAALLDHLGLTYTLRKDNYGLTALVSREPALLDEYAAAADRNDIATVGRLFGYPPTAVAAFLSGDTLESETQDTVEHDAGIADLSTFSFSRSNWRDEVNVILSWKRVLAQYGYA